MIPENPGDLGLPFSKWRPRQREMIERALSADSTVTVIEAPTGYGKSAAVAAASRFGPVMGLVGTKDLQQQYQDSFDWLQIVWGKGNYKCALPIWREQYHNEYGEWPTVETCPYDKRPEECPVFSDCPYYMAKRAASRSRNLITNYAYAYWTNWWINSIKPEIIFMDEAHTLPDHLAGFVSLEISERTAKRFGFPEFPLISGSGRGHCRLTAAWLGKCISILTDYIRVNATPKNVNRLSRSLKSYSDLYEALQTADDDEFYVSSGIGMHRFMARPISIPSSVFYRLAISDAKLVFMSATIGDPQSLLGQIGLGDMEFDFYSYPAIFAKENRPVYFNKNAPRLNNRSGDTDFFKQAKMIADVIRDHERQRGVIHTTSWKHTNILAGMLKEFGLDSRVYVPTSNRVQSVREFLNMDGAVAISPSWAEGLDFHDDLARFAVIAKVPFPSLADPVNRIKLKKDGRNWYDWRAAVKVVQAAGRIVRHEDDWGTTYIMDGNWTRVSRFAPKWFEVQTV